MREFGVLFFLIVINFHSFGQNNIGIPDIINYRQGIYNAGTGNRDIVQDKNGILYFANDEGLLSFDGTFWKLYPLPNKTRMRSLSIGADNKIYVGGQDDLGYFSPDQKGELIFTSLKSLLPEKNHSFTDIWNIVSWNKDIFFRSKGDIFRFSNNALTIYPAQTEWEFLGLSNNKLIAQDTKNGLHTFSGAVWEPLGTTAILPAGAIVTSFIPFGKDSSLVSTLKNGIFVLSGDQISEFKISGVNPLLNERILCMVPVDAASVAIGTQVQGCYIVSYKGEIIQKFSRNEGMQNNNVLSMLIDNNRNLWMGLDNGIDFSAFNNAIKHIFHDKLNEGSGYSSIINNNVFYAGTSTGLYKLPLGSQEDLSFVQGKFQPVPSITSPTWGLFEMNGNLLAATHEGMYHVKNNSSIPINNTMGYWSVQPLSNVMPSSTFVAANYYGLDVIQYKENGFVSLGNLANFKNPSRFIQMDNNLSLWIAHPYRGIYKLDMSNTSNPSIKNYDEKNGLPSTYIYHLSKVKNQVLIASGQGVYEYNRSTDMFERSSFYTKHFANENIRYIKEDNDGNTWFIQGKNLGVVDVSGQTPQIIYFPELNGKMATGFEHVFAYNKSNIVVGSERGFYHINYEQYRKYFPRVAVNIRSVSSISEKDSLFFGGYFGQVNEIAEQGKNFLPVINYNQNSVHLEFSAPLYQVQSNVEYSYLLEGFDKGWSAWSKKSEKDYTNLPAGTFTFMVKAKSNLGNESAVKTFSFKVLPPWYRSSIAYIVYGLLLASLLYYVYIWQKKKFLRQQQNYEEEQKRLKYLHQLELEKSEKEIVKLKNEKLQAEIEHKNKELASTAMHLLQKGEFLTKIKEDLLHMKGAVVENGSSGDVKKILKKLSEEEKVDKDWEQFATYFDQLHHDFLKKLKEHYPNLSASELKLCAYLLMNLSSKEIAQLMNISGRGVEISRYRLRKKLQIPTETNLYNFLLEFSS